MRHSTRTLPTLFAVTMLAVGLADAGGAAAQQAQTPALSVAEAVVTSEVRDREPADELSVVPSEAGRVFLWTRITGAEDEAEVLHVWYHGDEEVARVAQPVGSPNWRTWTSKEILPVWTGEWRVEVVGPGDRLLETVSFRVQ